jgi:hypothetical protein
MLREINLALLEIPGSYLGLANTCPDHPYLLMLVRG